MSDAPSISLKVISHADDANHIESIHLVHQTSDVIILLVNLKTKYKEVSCWGPGDSMWIGMDEVQFTLPPGFERCHMFASTSRYTTFVGIFRHDLLEQIDLDQNLLFDNPDPQGTIE